ncbi:MAG: hypothetical protein R3E54_18010 [Halioglobus sp.]
MFDDPETPGVFDFDELADHLLEQGADVSPAQVHGCLSGLLAAGELGEGERALDALAQGLELEAHGELAAWLPCSVLVCAGRWQVTDLLNPLCLLDAWTGPRRLSGAEAGRLCLQLRGRADEYLAGGGTPSVSSTPGADPEGVAAMAQAPGGRQSLAKQWLIDENRDEYADVMGGSATSGPYSTYLGRHISMMSTR